MNVIIINSPVVQPNTPYPSGAYLSAFFKSLNHQASWYDLNIDLFYSIFSRSGLEKLFLLSKKNALKMAEKAESSGDKETAFNLRRYLSTKNYWINWIEFITDNLCSPSKKSTREKEHEFLFSPFVPRGQRMEVFLSNLDHELSVDDVHFLCTFAIADLCDYINAVFDNNFCLISYAESVSSYNFDINKIVQQINSPVIKEFLLPLLQNKFNNIISNQNDEKTMICISSPFAGTFIPSLSIAKFFKESFGNKVFVCIGGGFINTDLRDVKDISLGKFVDAISFDRGYGSYKNFFDFSCNKGDSPLYKMLVFNHSENKISLPLWNSKEYEDFENKITAEIVPDYSDIDFSIYPRLCDDKNAMHRIWTDGTWIKAYLAHGCYWHKCAFCDTKLDYVCAYHPVQVEKLFNGLNKTAQEKKVFGIHFVDEALPPASLKKFALLNCREQRGQTPLTFWGNVRFEKTFTKDFAAFLSYSGLTAVSAGIEVATGQGLKNINKGTDLDSIVASCAAFKEAGILVHAYMIYGFWYDTPQTIIDSMETLRQFFECGLLDSAFWHKFELTKNSALYDTLSNTWDGGKKFEKFGNPLETALSYWMHGQKLDMKIQKWFDFQVPFPSIPKDFVEKSIEKYERQNNRTLNLENKSIEELENLFWLGTEPLVLNKKMYWNYLQEEQSCDYIISDFNKILYSLRPENSNDERLKTIQDIKKSPEILKQLNTLQGTGLVLI